MKKIFLTLFFIYICALFTGCASLKEPEKKVQSVRLLFGGDIMAHKPNFNMKNHEKIWTSIYDLSRNADLSFANIEAPVDNDLPYSSYPDFNMHSEYPEEAIKAGFNVFSLINNHSNDQGLDGIKATYSWAEKTEAAHRHSERKVYFTGIKKDSSSAIECRLIETNGWKILFCAVTEILNRPDYRNYLYYVEPTKKGREKFLAQLEQFRRDNPCDLFILSIHSNEPEYIAEVSTDRRNYYHKILEKNVDIIWSNHPHIPREKEFIGNGATQSLEKAIIYGNGNLISGQRWEPDFDNPENPRDDTGDSYLLELVFEKDGCDGKPRIARHKTHYITTYINSNWEFVIKKLDDEFIQYLADSRSRRWSDYIRQRKQITEKTKETITWQ